MLKGGFDTMNTDSEKAIAIHKIIKEDGPAVHRLVNSCPPLDRNSRYLYLLVCSHFDRYSVTAKKGNSLIGFISAYKHPEKEDTIFIWQVAVASEYRKYGVGSRMLHDIVSRAVSDGIFYLETTVTPSNAASFGMFKKLADAYDAGFHQSIYFPRVLLGDDHEDEVLLRIGPIIKTGGTIKHGDI